MEDSISDLETTDGKGGASPDRSIALHRAPRLVCGFAALLAGIFGHVVNGKGSVR